MLQEETKIGTVNLFIDVSKIETRIRLREDVETSVVINRHSK